MDSNNLPQADLVRIIGSSGLISEVVNGKRNISINQAKAFANFLNVPAELFI